MENYDYNNKSIIDINDVEDQLSEINEWDLVQLINEQEKEWKSNLTNDEELKEKLKDLEEFCRKVKSMKQLGHLEYSKIKEYAKTRGGFLVNDIRIFLWKKLYGIESKEKDKYELVYIRENIFPNEEYCNVFEYKYESVDIKIKNSFEHVIKVDVKRSKINRLFSRTEGYSNCNFSLKKKLKLFINTMSSINNRNYNYFQGYHDIGLYFLLLYLNDYKDAVELFQRFSEFNLKENLIQHDDVNMKGFNFIHCLNILNDLIERLDPEIKKMIDELCFGQPAFAISWIVTLFTHNIINSTIQYRLLDYFVVSHPLAVYHLTAHIVIEEFGKLKNKRNLVRIYH